MEQQIILGKIVRDSGDVQVDGEPQVSTCLVGGGGVIDRKESLLVSKD